MGIDHGRLHVVVAEQLLHDPDVVPRLQKVRREGVAKSERAGWLRDLCRPRRVTHRSLNDLFPHVVAPLGAAARVDRTKVRPPRILTPVRLSRRTLIGFSGETWELFWWPLPEAWSESRVKLPCDAAGGEKGREADAGGTDFLTPCAE
jgi:hypothetical protein